MQRRASKGIAFKDILSFLLVAVFTVIAITVLSAATRWGALNSNTYAEPTAQEAEPTTLSAVIPEDNSYKVVAVAVGVAVTLVVVTAVAAVFHVQKKYSNISKKRKYAPSEEVTFKRISRREMVISKR